MGIVQLAHLKCKKCGTEFDYAFVPSASVTAIRLWNRRYFSCPQCHKASLFNIGSNRVDPATHHCELRVGPS